MSARAPTDNDRRVQALHAIQQGLEASTELSHDVVDQVVQLVKPQLKNNNFYVVLGALQCLPALFSRLRPVHAALGSNDSQLTHQATAAAATTRSLEHQLKQIVSNVLPTDKLGDSKQQVRDAARDAIVQAARTSLLLTSGTNNHPQPGAAKETSWQVIESRMQEHGFHSKNAKAREQAILFVTAIRSQEDSTTPIAPLRPFTPLLLAALGDSDPTVRSLALSSTISIFSASTVSPAAKADLKKSMAKLEVNKKIQDQILSAVLGGESVPIPSQEGFQTDATQGPEHRPRPRPPSPSTLIANLPAAAFPTDPSAVHAPPSEIQPVYVANERDLHAELEQMKPCFEGKETEHNWVARDKSIARIRGLVRGGAAQKFKDAFLAALKSVEEGILKTSSSLRTTLAISALSLMTELAEAFGTNLDHHFLESFLNHCLGMAGQTKKIVATASQQTVTALLTHSKYHFKTLQQVTLLSQDKNVSARQFAATHLQTIVQVHVQTHKHAFETTGGVDEVEKALKRGLTDPNAQVKETSRTTFWLVQAIWPKMGDRVACALDASSRKQLDRSDPRRQEASNQVGFSTSSRTSPAASNGNVEAKSGAKTTSATTKPARPSVREMMLQAKREKAQKEQEMEAQLAATAEMDSVTSSPASARPAAPSFTNSPAEKSQEIGTMKTPLVNQERPHLSSSPSSPTDLKRTSHIPLATSPRGHAVRSPSSEHRSLHGSSDDEIKSRQSEAHPALKTPAVSRQVQQDVFNDSPDVKQVESFKAAGSGSNWWSLKNQNGQQTSSAQTGADAELYHEFDGLVKSICAGNIDAQGLKRLSVLSTNSPVSEQDLADNEAETDASPSRRNNDSSRATLWTTDRRFMKVYQGLTALLSTPNPTLEVQDTALTLLNSLVQHQLPCLAGEETSLFGLLFKLRQDSSRTVIAATEAIGSNVIAHSEPVLTLGLLCSALTTYLDRENKGQIDANVARSFALGLRLMGGLFEKLPSEVLEDELPNRAELVKRGLNDASAELRRAAVQCLVSAYTVLRNEDKVYQLVGKQTLHRDQINLLSYYMSKVSI
ncbi:suppressor of tub2 mutation [Microbotryomycetes sp. JL221]|nr:suppressor of tub2 mutation [Microbotryomycetes sp. JL221]